MVAEIPKWSNEDIMHMFVYLADKELGWIAKEEGSPELVENCLQIFTKAAKSKEADPISDTLWGVLHCPKDDALLYINSTEAWVAHIAAWRLANGR